MNETEYEMICNYIWNMEREIYITFNRDEKLMLKEELEHHNTKAEKINENRYVVTFNGDILYFVCPLNATKQTQEDWKELKWIFKEYE